LDSGKQILDRKEGKFGLRLRALIDRHGLSHGDFQQLMGISRATLFNWFKRDRMPPSRGHQAKLAQIFPDETREYILDGVVTPESKIGQVQEGKPVAFRKSGTQEYSPRDRRLSGSAEMVDPRFLPRTEPTAQMCAEYFAEYLARAEREAGGIGFTWRLLQKHFPLDEFEPPTKAPP
jgi:transcriptional regulator with XRE-family HTH domain